MQFSPVLPAEFSIIATMRMPEATLPLQWDLFKIADGHIQYRLVVDGSNRSIRFTVSDNNKYEIIRAEDRFQFFFEYLDSDQKRCSFGRPQGVRTPLYLGEWPIREPRQNDS